MDQLRGQIKQMASCMKGYGLVSITKMGPHFKPISNANTIRGKCYFDYINIYKL